MLQPDDVLVDCTGARSLMREILDPGDDSATDRNTNRLRLEHALVVTFLYDQHYECNEYCKYYKNVYNRSYKFIPSVRRRQYDGSISHVTGIVKISAEEFDGRSHSAWRVRSSSPATCSTEPNRSTTCAAGTSSSCMDSGCGSTCATQMIKHNKHVLESVDDTFSLLEKPHVY